MNFIILAANMLHNTKKSTTHDTLYPFQKTDGVTFHDTVYIQQQSILPPSCLHGILVSDPFSLQVFSEGIQCLLSGKLLLHSLNHVRIV